MLRPQRFVTVGRQLRRPEKLPDPEGEPAVRLDLHGQGGRFEKRNCTITLINEDGSEKFVEWTLTDAFPISLTIPNLPGGPSNEATIREVTVYPESVNVKTF
ncbi:phage tail protein [Streptomyces sp. NPDC050315]|uniref:phage tail protein n=1 Tax=Streptomyces sp. NPDC050315 TaxID=3155039 RepID=UPI003437250B